MSGWIPLLRKLCLWNWCVLVFPRINLHLLFSLFLLLLLLPLLIFPGTCILSTDQCQYAPCVQRPATYVWPGCTSGVPCKCDGTPPSCLAPQLTLGAVCAPVPTFSVDSSGTIVAEDKCQWELVCGVFTFLGKFCDEKPFWENFRFHIEYFPKILFIFFRRTREKNRLYRYRVWRMFRAKFH